MADPWSSPGVRVSRRAFVVGTGAAVIGFAATVQRWPEIAEAQATQSALTAFLSLSSRLTEKRNLNPIIATKALIALESAFPGFDDDVKALLTYLNEHPSLTASNLQADLVKNRPLLIPVAQRVVTAWYLGIVGDTNPRVVAYEQALMFPPVSSALNVQSYCLGETGVWARRPA